MYKTILRQLMCSIASVLYLVLILHIVVYTEKLVQMTGSCLIFRITLKNIDCSQKKKSIGIVLSEM